MGVRGRGERARLQHLFFIASSVYLCDNVIFKSNTKSIRFLIESQQKHFFTCFLKWSKVLFCYYKVLNVNNSSLSTACSCSKYGDSTSMDSLKTEEHVKKITLSDLQALGIKKAMEVQVLLVLKNPTMLYYVALEALLSICSCMSPQQFCIILLTCKIPLFVWRSVNASRAVGGVRKTISVNIMGFVTCN